MSSQHHRSDVSTPPAEQGARAVVVLAAGVVCIAFVGALTGCYERVVNARGLGADQYSVSEPYQESDSRIDKWLFGPTPSAKQREGSLLDRR